MGSGVGTLDRLWRALFPGRDSHALVCALVARHGGTLAPSALGWWNRIHSEREHFCVGNTHKRTALFGPSLNAIKARLRGSLRSDRGVGSSCSLEGVGPARDASTCVLRDCEEFPAAITRSR
jgi:hypothetical protein